MISNHRERTPNGLRGWSAVTGREREREERERRERGGGGGGDRLASFLVSVSVSVSSFFRGAEDKRVRVALRQLYV